MNEIQPIHVAPTTERKTEPGRFGTALRAAAHGVAASVASTVELAAPFVPGGMILSGAIRGVAAAGAGVTAAVAGGTSGASAAGGGDLLEATRTLQREAQTFNLSYLRLQEAMQRESREFTALSNVMKVKHDSAKAAIHNIH
jgi:hypothetical protein